MQPTPRAWQRMLSGRKLDLLEPSPIDIEIEDIAHGLARVARWNGQTKGEHSFSVAQHAVLVEKIARETADSLLPSVLMSVLLHDAAEYVIGDMITPLKSVLSVGYKAIENKLMHAIHSRFQLSVEPHFDVIELIKKADRIAAFYEATYLAGFSKAEAEPLFGEQVNMSEAVLSLLGPLATQKAQALFLARFSEIQAEMHNKPIIIQAY